MLDVLGRCIEAPLAGVSHRHHAQLQRMDDIAAAEPDAVQYNSS